MRRVQHPNVVRLYEVIDTPTTLYLVMELAEGGDLYDYILRHEGGVAEVTAKRHFAQIVRAVSYCHQLHVVHRDLKPENVVFFPQQGAVKLTDFGFSNLFQPGMMLATSCGSLAYSAPEILLGEEYDAPAVGEKNNFLFCIYVLLFCFVFALSLRSEILKLPGKPGQRQANIKCKLVLYNIIIFRNICFVGYLFFTLLLW